MHLQLDSQPDGVAKDRTLLYSSRVMIAYVEYLKRFHPEIDTDALLEQAGMARYAVEDPGHWFSQEQADQLHRMVEAKTGNPNIARDAGRFWISSDRMNAAKQYVLGLISPAAAYLISSKMSGIMTRGSKFESKKLASNKVEIVSTPIPGTHEKPYQCQNRIGVLEAVAALFTGQFAHIDHPNCFHRGDPYCRYLISWARNPSMYWQKTGLVLLPVAMLGVFAAFLFNHLPVWRYFSLLFAFLPLALLWYAEHCAKKEIGRTLRSQGDAAKDLMYEIDIRHRDAMLIQESGQAIAKILDVDKLIETVVTVMKKHLDYDRGMIMLADEKKTRLRYIAGYGYDAEQGQLLKKTQFNLQNGSSESLLVRCYQEQKSFAVNDVADIEKTVSPNSREFIRRMGVKSFACVPIVYEQESLGILAVENIHAKKHLAQSEISLLTGVAAQTAISIINAGSFKKTKESEIQYRLLADNISDVIWIIDIAELKFSYISPSVKNMQGYTPEEIMNIPLKDILTPASFTRVNREINTELERARRMPFDLSRSRTMEVEVFHKCGSTLLLEITASFLRDEQGQVVSILGASRDISERKQAEIARKKLEAQLQQAQKMEAIGTLAGGIAHDFNNILSAIFGYTELALDQIAAKSPLNGHLQGILKAGNRARELVRQILAFSRHTNQEMRPVQMNLVVEEAVKLLRASLPSTIDIRQNLTSDASVLADATQIHQVIMNLCTNADHAMRETGGTLEISLAEVDIEGVTENQKPGLFPGHYLCLAVRDTGHGMSEEIQQRIFEPFFTTKGRDVGTGMGLAVVHGIIQSHKGAIGVESAPGKGTRFDVYLPVIKNERRQHREVSENLQQGKGHILFVDDEKAIADVGKQMLERLGYRVSARTSSSDALALFAASPHEFDLVFTDMTMPQLTGDKLAQRMLEIRPDIPIIICTGYSQVLTEEKVKDLGIRELLLKPFATRDMAAAVRRALKTT